MNSANDCDVDLKGLDFFEDGTTDLIEKVSRSSDEEAGFLPIPEIPRIVLPVVSAVIKHALMSTPNLRINFWSKHVM